MKVLLVNGGPHREGCTHTALREVAAVLEQQGIETEEFWVGNEPLAGCIACGACAETGECFRKDAVNRFLEKAGAADGFVFGSPVHYAAASGALLAGAALWAARTFLAASAAVPGFFGLAGGLLFFCAMAELLSTRDLDPARRERDREDHDERGAMIRAMARARAGDVLLWLLLFGAAYLYFFDVPKWVSLILLTVACVKLLLEWMFTVWYRRQY